MARRQVEERRKVPLILICTEGGKGSAEYNYLRNFKSRNLRIDFATGNSTDPKGMLLDLKRYMNSEDIKSEDNCRIFLVIDTDLSDLRIDEIVNISYECEKLGVEIITSSPTFEIWFLMHFEGKKLRYFSSKDVKKEMEKIIGVHYGANINIFNYVCDLTDIAINKATDIEKAALKNNNELIRCNPHSSIYRILLAIREFEKLC